MQNEAPLIQAELLKRGFIRMNHPYLAGAGSEVFYKLTYDGKYAPFRPAEPVYLVFSTIPDNGYGVWLCRFDPVLYHFSDEMVVRLGVFSYELTEKILALFLG